MTCDYEWGVQIEYNHGKGWTTMILTSPSRQLAIDSLKKERQNAKSFPTMYRNPELVCRSVSQWAVATDD